MNCKAILFILLSVMAIYGCKKDKSVSQLNPELPTENLEGRYIWHTATGEVVLNGIEVDSDTMLSISSSFENTRNSGAPPEYYRYTSSNDSEIVYRLLSESITYKFKRNLVIWNTNGSTRYGVPGETKKWAPIHDLQLEGQKLWVRTKTYYIIYASGALKDTTVTLSDTTGSAFLLLESVSGYKRESLLLAGADSTGIVYQARHYDAGPNSLSVVGAIRYWVANDSIHSYYESYGPYGTDYTFDSK